MLRQVFDWAASRSTELLTRYKQMASNIGFDISAECECNKEMKHGAGHATTTCGRSRGLGEEGSEDYFTPSTRRRRRKTRRQSTTPTLDDNFKEGVKRKCSSAGLEVPNDSKILELGGLTLTFDRLIRLPVNGSKSMNEFTESGDRETYAQIVRTSKAAREEWLKVVNQYTKLMMTELEKWRSRFGIFSVTGEIVSNAVIEAKKGDSVKHRILIQHLTKKLREYFGDILQHEEIMLWQDGSIHKVLYFGPTEEAIVRKIKRKQPQKEIGVPHYVQKETGFYDRSVTAKIEVEDSFTTIEDKFWTKQDHYLKRKSGKANRKKLRVSGPGEYVPSKKEKALMKGNSGTISVTESVIEAKTTKSEQPKGKLRRELLNRNRENEDNVLTIQLGAKQKKSKPDQEAEESLPKRLEIMQAKYRRFMKKLERARNKKQLQRR